MWGGDVTAAGYNGAPQHNTHTVTAVKIRSRRRMVVVVVAVEGRGGRAERWSVAPRQPRGEINAEPCAHGADTVAGVRNRHARSPSERGKYS